MLPGVVADEMQGSVSDFLRTAFPFSTAYFQRYANGPDSPTQCPQFPVVPDTSILRPGCCLTPKPLG